MFSEKYSLSCLYCRRPAVRRQPLPLTVLGSRTYGWVDPFGRGPSAYEVAKWLYLPRNEELDTSQPLGLRLYGLVSEALQALEHASLVRSHLMFGFQGTAADAHMTYVLTRYGVSVRDAGGVERILSGTTPSG